MVIHNPKVGSSILPPATNYFNTLQHITLLFERAFPEFFRNLRQSREDGSGFGSCPL
jgi:hypothetical protein